MDTFEKAKKGDRVYHFQYGWGTVIGNTHPNVPDIVVKFDWHGDVCQYTWSGYALKSNYTPDDVRVLFWDDRPLGPTKELVKEDGDKPGKVVDEEGIPVERAVLVREYKRVCEAFEKEKQHHNELAEVYAKAKYVIILAKKQQSWGSDDLSKAIFDLIVADDKFTQLCKKGVVWDQNTLV